MMSSNRNKADRQGFRVVRIELQGSLNVPHAAVNVRVTYPPEEPPGPPRGEPVEPSPMRGTAAENDRVKTARLAVLAERTMD
jgi:hypothetical protein